MMPSQSMEMLKFKTKLFCAIRSSDTEEASRIFKLGIDTDTRFLVNSDYVPAILLSVKANDIKMVRMMLELGVSVNQKDGDGHTALSLACLNGSTEMAELLLENNANPNVKDDEGFPPLFYACEVGDTELVQLLLDNGANINARDPEGRVPLHVAVRRHEVIAKVLIENGADISLTDIENNNVLHYYAERYPDPSITKYLCERFHSGILKYNVDCEAPLHKFFRHKDAHESLEIMLSFASTNVRECISVMHDRWADGYTALHISILTGSLENTRLLLAAGVDPNMLNSYNETPLDVVCRFTRNESLAKLLITAGGKCSYATRHLARGKLPFVLHNMIANSMKNPPKLTVFCRRSFVSYYNPQLTQVLKNQRIPYILKKYLLFRDN